jgi:hypothetical protein
VRFGTAADDTLACGTGFAGSWAWQSGVAAEMNIPQSRIHNVTPLADMGFSSFAQLFTKYTCLQLVKV